MNEVPLHRGALLANQGTHRPTCRSTEHILEHILGQQSTSFCALAVCTAFIIAALRASVERSNRFLHEASILLAKLPPDALILLASYCTRLRYY